jgi:hypothetical protein
MLSSTYKTIISIKYAPQNTVRVNKTCLLHFCFQAPIYSNYSQYKNWKNRKASHVTSEFDGRLSKQENKRAISSTSVHGSMKTAIKRT